MRLILTSFCLIEEVFEFWGAVLGSVTSFLVDQVGYVDGVHCVRVDGDEEATDGEGNDADNYENEG